MYINSPQPTTQLIINDDLLSSNSVHVSYSLAATPPRKGLWLVHFCVDITIIGFNTYSAPLRSGSRLGPH